MPYRSHPPHQLDPTTRTVEMSQIAELNDALADRSHPPVTADQVGLTGVTSVMHHDEHLPGSAVMLRLRWDGPPSYPYIHGEFSVGPGQLVVVDLHTEALRLLARHLGLRQTWGVAP